MSTYTGGDPGADPAEEWTRPDTPLIDRDAFPQLTTVDVIKSMTFEQREMLICAVETTAVLVATSTFAFPFPEHIGHRVAESVVEHLDKLIATRTATPVAP